MHCVLVHGSFHGPWCWERLVDSLPESWSFAMPDLREIPAAGHPAHLASYLRDDCLVVVHSYAGMIAGEAVAMAGVTPCKVIYLDAFVPRAGESAFDMLGAFGKSMPRGPQGALLPPPASMLGVDDPADAEWLERRLQPFPSETHERVSAIDATRMERAVYVRCARFPGFADAEDRARKAGWSVETLDAGHDAMISHPAALADVMEKLA